MAVPFTFPEENNDVEVIIRQLNLMLNRLAVEFKKQRIEIIQLRARNKEQRAATNRQKNAQNNASVGDTNAISTTCKHPAMPESRVIAIKRSICIAKNPAQSTVGNIQSSDNRANATAIATTNSNEGDEEQQIQEQQQQQQQQRPVVSLIFFGERLQFQMIWSWFAPSALTRTSFWTTAVICVVGWHLSR